VDTDLSDSYDDHVRKSELSYHFKEEQKDLKSKAEIINVNALYFGFDALNDMRDEFHKKKWEPFFIAKLAYKFEWTIISHLLSGCNANHRSWLSFSKLRSICKHGRKVDYVGIHVFKSSQDIRIVRKKWRELDEQLCLDNRVYYAVRYFKKAGYKFRPPFPTVQELKQHLNTFSVPYDEELMLIASRMIMILESFNVNSLQCKYIVSGR
jgi:hypothetical protein